MDIDVIYIIEFFFQKHTRVLQFIEGSLFDCKDAWDADIIICETVFEAVNKIIH
jgi:hypothetical protein